jgi:hypothetical protein
VKGRKTEARRLLARYNKLPAKHVIGESFDEELERRLEAVEQNLASLTRRIRKAVAKPPPLGNPTFGFTPPTPYVTVKNLALEKRS